MMAILVAQGVVFAIWAFVAFRALFRLFALLRYRSGEALAGAIDAVAGGAGRNCGHAALGAVLRRPCS